ncbi:MAG: arylsulfatase [Verrucomicrobia bacterium]|nr:arylsulfatase [Verrucomicrobiota bacterium]
MPLTTTSSLKGSSSAPRPFHTPWTRGWALILALALTGPAFAQGAANDARALVEAAMARRQPNILLIVADDLGYGDLGCYGQQRIRTPNLDRLAREGARFTQFYAGSTVCAPSRAVLMTGRHTGHQRIRGNDQRPLLPGEGLLASLLQKGRYQTALFGKWGLGQAGSSGEPNRQGFEEWRGYLDQVHAHDYYPSNLFRNGEPWALPQNENGRKGLYAQDLFMQMTTNYLRTAQFRPFFLYLAWTLPHANNELGRATGNGMEIPSDAPYSSEPWPAPEKNKAAMITRMDRDVGRVLDILRAYKMETNTLVLFTSDNGPHSEGGVKAEFHKSSGPLRGIKRDMYEGGIRVPLIARWPGRIPAGRVSEELWAFWDLLPTLTDCALLPRPEGIDGLSMYRDLLGLATTNRHAHLYWEFHEGGSKQAARVGDWKGIRNEAGGKLELYNLKSDIGETNNVAAARPDVVEKVEAILKSARTDDPDWPLKPKPPSPPAAAGADR